MQDQKKIESLPKWAQSYIKELFRERQVAVDALNKYLDEQTASPFFVDDYLSTGETQGPSFKTRYIQAPHRMSVVYRGVRLDITLRDNILLSWAVENWSTREVALIPKSYQQAELITKENMR